jgi:hypothetical protein
MTKDEIVAIIKECAAELGHVPTMPEVEKTTGMTRYQVERSFGNYGNALKACGLEGRGAGHRISDDVLCQEWALVVRRLRRLPTVYEYRQYSTRSIRPFLDRYKTWRKVPERVLEYLRTPGIRAEWEDVIEILRDRLESSERENRTSKFIKTLPSPAAIQFKETFYGPPLFPCAVTYAPVNELGVMVLFAALAKDLGFTITHIQTQFPDGEVMREVEPGRHQRLPVEFEYESRNFVTHGHPVDGCKLIICWRHNWPECPVEVLELKSVVEGMNRSAARRE